MTARASGPLEPATVGSRRGLIWGFDFSADRAEAIDGTVPDLAFAAPDPAAFRWLHVNLVDQWTRRWFETSELPPAVRELLLSPDRHQRALVADGAVACIVHDFEREFDAAAPERMGARMGSLTFLLLPGLMVTARQHPVCAADLVYARVQRGVRPVTTAAALDLLLSAVLRVTHDVVAELTATVQTAEDALLDDGREPDARALLVVRKRAIQLNRQMIGLRGVLARLEDDDELPDDLAPVVAKLAQRATALDGDIGGVQGNLRVLREELDVQTASRTGQNLYLLSILSALLLPATLVTGVFGMNTGGMPGTDAVHGTAMAIALGVASSAAVFLWLRARGFFRR